MAAVVLGIDVGIVNLAGTVVFFDENNAPVSANCARVSISSSKDPVNLVIENLVSFLRDSDIFSNREITRVVIEQQLARAPKNMAVYGALTAYYHHCRSIGTLPRLVAVETLIAREKFNRIRNSAYFSSGIGDVFTTREVKKRSVKAFSVDLARQICRENHAFLQVWNAIQNEKKKDDLADSFIMAIS